MERFFFNAIDFGVLTDRLPSVSQLLELFLSPQRTGPEPFAPSRERRESNVPPGLWSSGLNIEGYFPPANAPTELYQQELRSYSHVQPISHLRTTSFPHQYRFPPSAAPKEGPSRAIESGQTVAGSNKQDIPVEDIGEFIPSGDASREAGAKEGILRLLSRLARSDSVIQVVRTLQLQYIDLLQRLLEITSSQDDFLKGTTQWKGSPRYILQQDYEEFIALLPLQNIEELIDALENSLAALEHVKNARVAQKSRPFSSNREEKSLMRPGEHPKGHHMRARTTPTIKTTPTKQMTQKRRKSTMSNVVFSTQRRPSVSSPGGDIIPLDISAPMLRQSFTQPNKKIEIGTLNTELSIRQEIVCSHCGSRDTPEWRKGIDGSRTLCNACGLFYSKLTKKYSPPEAARIMKERKEKGLVLDRRLK